MEKELFLFVTEDVEEFTVEQETAKKSVPGEHVCRVVLGIEEAAFKISNPMVRVRQLTTPSSPLWL